MTWPAPKFELCRRTQPPADAWGDTPRAWAPPELLPVLDAAPASTEDAQEHREESKMNWTLYLPSGASASALDRVLVDGIPYEVIGDSAEWGLGAVITIRRIER